MSKKKNSSWTVKEDELLTELVNKYGSEKDTNWEKISKKYPKRNAKQCKERWLSKNAICNSNKNNLDQSWTTWTEDENATLIENYLIFGDKWDLIKEHLPGRTSDGIKNHWNNYLKILMEKNLFDDEEEEESKTTALSDDNIDKDKREGHNSDTDYNPYSDDDDDEKDQDQVEAPKSKKSSNIESNQSLNLSEKFSFDPFEKKLKVSLTKLAVNFLEPKNSKKPTNIETEQKNESKKLTKKPSEFLKSKKSNSIGTAQKNDMNKKSSLKVINVKKPSDKKIEPFEKLKSIFKEVNNSQIIEKDKNIEEKSSLSLDKSQEPANVKSTTDDDKRAKNLADLKMNYKNKREKVNLYQNLNFGNDQVKRNNDKIEIEPSPPEKKIRLFPEDPFDKFLLITVEKLPFGLILKKSQNNENDKKYECSICEKEFESLDLVIKHQDSHQEESGSGRNKCLKCGMVFNSLFSLNSHITLLHRFNTTCTICQKEFPNHFMMKKHLKSHQKETTNNIGNKKKPGRPPGIAGTRPKGKPGPKSKKSTSNNTSNNGETFNCEQCNKTFTFKSMLNCHLLQKHKIVLKNYSCKYCQAKFISKRLLAHHISVDCSVKKDEILARKTQEKELILARKEEKREKIARVLYQHDFPGKRVKRDKNLNFSVISVDRNNEKIHVGDCTEFGEMPVKVEIVDLEYEDQDQEGPSGPSTSKASTPQKPTTTETVKCDKCHKFCPAQKIVAHLANHQRYEKWKKLEEEDTKGLLIRKCFCSKSFKSQFRVARHVEKVHKMGKLKKTNLDTFLQKDKEAYDEALQIIQAQKLNSSNSTAPAPTVNANVSQNVIDKDNTQMQEQIQQNNIFLSPPSSSISNAPIIINKNLSSSEDCSQCEPLRCTHCQNVFPTKIALGIHLQVHTKGKVFIVLKDKEIVEMAKEIARIALPNNLVFVKESDLTNKSKTPVNLIDNSPIQIDNIVSLATNKEPLPPQPQPPSKTKELPPKLSSEMTNIGFCRPLIRQDTIVTTAEENPTVTNDINLKTLLNNSPSVPPEESNRIGILRNTLNQNQGTGNTLTQLTLTATASQTPIPTPNIQNQMGVYKQFVPVPQNKTPLQNLQQMQPQHRLPLTYYPQKNNYPQIPRFIPITTATNNTRGPSSSSEAVYRMEFVSNQSQQQPPRIPIMSNTGAGTSTTTGNLYNYNMQFLRQQSPQNQNQHRPLPSNYQNVIRNIAPQPQQTYNRFQNPHPQAQQAYNIQYSQHSYNIQNPGQAYNIQNPGQVYNIQNPGQVYNIQNPGQVYNIQNPGQVYNIQNSGQAYNIQNSGQVYNIQNPGQAYNIQNSGQPIQQTTTFPVFDSNLQIVDMYSRSTSIINIPNQLQSQTSSNFVDNDTTNNDNGDEEILGL